MNTTRIQKLAATLTLTLGALAPVACDREGNPSSLDVAEPGAAAASAEKTSAIALQIEQAERKLDVGREIPAARAALEEALRDPAATPDQRDQAKLGMSRVLEAEGKSEAATSAVEALLAQHGEDGSSRWALRDAAAKRLRKLVTGSEAEPKQARKQDLRQASNFAHALTRFFPKAEAGRQIEVKTLVFGGDAEVSERLGTFDIGRALREDRRKDCPLCDENLSINTSQSSSDWIGIPMHRPQLGAAVAVYYFDLGAERIPARYDAELPIPSAEIVAHLERGDGLVSARERPGAPPVILIAAPRRAQLAAVEEALAMMKALPPLLQVVSVPAKLQTTEIQDVVRAEFPSFRVCYEELLKRSPTAAGNVPVKFVIQSDGTVSDVAIDSASTLRDATFEQCMTAAFAPLTFPTAPDKTTVTYPIAFSPGE